jgi:hypothetical protein
LVLAGVVGALTPVNNDAAKHSSGDGTNKRLALLDFAPGYGHRVYYQPETGQQPLTSVPEDERAGDRHQHQIWYRRS